jgi:hypothetical protein
MRSTVILITEKRGGITVKNALLRLILLVLFFPALSGCWYAVAAGAGAAVGYEAKEKGYGLQSPVAKEKAKTKQNKDEK